MASSVQYAVVAFENNSASVVPLKWLDEEEENCYWPPPKSKARANTKSLIKRCVQRSSDWELLPVRVLGKASK